MWCTSPTSSISPPARCTVTSSPCSGATWSNRAPSGATASPPASTCSGSPPATASTWSGTLARAAELEEATTALNAALAERAAADPAPADRGLRALARPLIPLVCTSEGRYGHEAADITPRMSTHRASVYPGLDRAFELRELEGSDACGFLRTELRRQANRFAETLAAAERARGYAGDS